MNKKFVIQIRFNLRDDFVNFVTDIRGIYAIQFASLIAKLS